MLGRAEVRDTGVVGRVEVELGVGGVTSIPFTVPEGGLQSQITLGEEIISVIA